jgi:hypothetical protein
VESLASLSMCKILRYASELKIALIGDDFEGLRKAFKIHMPIFECFCDSKHLIVIDLVIVFSFVHRL